MSTATKSKTKGARELIFGNLWEYDPAPETASPKLQESYDLFIGGKSVKPRSKQYFDSINPATGLKLASIAQADARDVDEACEAAQGAYDKTWSKLAAAERGKYLYRIARLLQDRSREFAVAETMDGGKPIKESRDFDVPMAAAHFFYHAGWTDKLEYLAPGRKVTPHGVVGQVIPWNFPLLMLAWKIAPALAAGNCVVIKPAETTSITAMKFATLLQEAELPPGVVNIVSGFGDAGSAIMTHKLTKKVAFTGSTEVGKGIMKSLAATDKKMTMELGGKGANIVLDDAPLDQAVEGIVNGIFFNQGHVCCAGSRLLVQEGVAEVVVEKLKRRLATLRVGDPMDKNTDVGAINSSEQLERIKALVESGVEEGAGMYQPECALPEQGFYFKPTLLTGVTQSHRVANEEIFGPVLSVLTFRTVDEAVEKANNSSYGLSAGVWTDKGSKILKLASELKAGVVWANTYNKFDPGSPFGGYKESGFGREGGKQGLLDYLVVG
ncbi:aldehyde dehydrogenase family protein [Phragmitibacter flavus]|uniref:Aldehyde dehydrogenase family protein n=1 Tax=Phragmitibacter flavus TaxID=2576071 RepID=A0A5R8KHM8_9BACT|nr:aldehyde dehydrogenase family protein [Phragmitibacter flavus]TLD71782.1 aldehyde dehydrogenase family protein [Phragmitibacter flavus]